MSSSQDHNLDGLACSRPIPSDVSKALKYMREGAGRKISIAHLVAYCGVAERTLRKHFRAFMAASPLEYWRRLRLAAAREDLLAGANGASITEVATRFGFNHFGRFSQQYRRCFGEAPSATLRRSRFGESERIARIGGDGRNCAETAVVATRVSRERPSIAVLPCRVVVAEPKHLFFGECVAEGIAVALCRVRAVSVIIPRSSQCVGSPDTKRLARELGAHYLLIGSIAQTDERLRVIIRLIDATDDFHVWGDTYDGGVGDLLALQDRVTEGVLRAILPHIRGAEIERARRKRPEDLGAYDLAMRAFPFAFAAHPGAARQALDLLNRAMEIDPGLRQGNRPRGLVPCEVGSAQRHSLPGPGAVARAVA